MGHQIVSVKPLHHDNDSAPIQIVEPAPQRIVVPGVYGLSAGVGECFVSFERVINNDDVATPAGYSIEPTRSSTDAPVRCADALRMGRWL